MLFCQMPALRCDELQFIACCLCLGLYGNRGILPAKNVLDKGMHCCSLKSSYKYLCSFL